MSKITGVEAVTKDKPARAIVEKDGERIQRNGLGLENFRDGNYWLWMGDGETTLAVQMTPEEVERFAMALSLFPLSEYGAG